MNKTIFIVLALTSLFISTQAASTVVVCYKTDGTTADANCASCPNSGPATCTACNTGYYLVSGVCTQCVTGCAVCTGTTAATCTTAADNYYLSGGVLTQCLANCKTCTGTAASYAQCTAPMTGYVLDGTAITQCSDTGCAVCTTTAGTGQCTTSKAGYVTLAATGTPTGCESTTLCKTCSSATVCTAAVTGAYVDATNDAVACSDLSAATCSATASLTCTKGTLDTLNLCCGVQNCATCVASTNAQCTTCKTGYRLASATSCVACTAASNCATCPTDASTCSTCPTGYALSGTAGVSGTTCVATTPVPYTSSPSSAFNVTPVAVYTSTDTTAPAFSAVASATTVYGPGFDSETAYVWLVDTPAVTATGTYAVNRRTINTTAFSKSNSSADTAITTSIAGTASILTAVAPGYLGIASYVAGSNWNTATATASEISITYIAGNGTATTKAITGNTNTGVFFKLLSHWYLNGTFYVVYAMNTHTIGTAAAADTWVYNGIYIHGVVVSTGALLNYTTGGVKMLSLTQTNSGSTSCIALTGTGCASTPSSSLVSSFEVGVQNFTQNSDTVWYLWSDTTTSNAYTIKLGSINVTTGAATSGTTLTTTAASTGTDPVVSTSYSIAGFHSSDSGSFGAYINKLVTSDPATGDNTYTSTVLSYINGTTTAQTTLYSLTPPTGYRSSSVMGFGTTDGFILVQTAYSTATTTPAQPWSAQAQRFYTNGTALTTSAVALGTYSAAPTVYQDTNGTIVVGYTLADTLTQNTYSGYLGSYVVQAMAANTLTSIFAFLSLLIVALFAF